MLRALAALYGAAGLTTGRARAREERIALQYPPLGRIIRTAGQDVHVWQAGAGPDLVLIHGASANLREFTMGLAPRLAGRFRVTAFDRPGLGWSAPVGSTDPADQARVLASACAQLGISRPLVLGHSYGGAVALAWGLEPRPATPPSGLFLLSAVAIPWEGSLGLWYRLTASETGRALAVPLVTAFAPSRRIERSIAEVFAPEPVPPGYATAAGVPLILRRGPLAVNAAQVTGLLPHIRRMAPQYPGLHLPVEILHGDSDTIVPAAVHALPLAARLPDVRLSLLPGAGHMPHHTRAPEVEAALIRLAARAAIL